MAHLTNADTQCWTLEDFEIICNQPHTKHSCSTLDAMLMDDSREAALVYDLVVGHLLDEQAKYYEEESLHAWAQAADDDYHAMVNGWDDDFAF